MDQLWRSNSRSLSKAGDPTAQLGKQAAQTLSHLDPPAELTIKLCSSPSSVSPTEISANATAAQGGTHRFALETRARHTRRSSSRARTGCATCEFVMYLGLVMDLLLTVSKASKYPALCQINSH